ncbi:hypothetical protein V7S43_017266 [Phytophthora oleae]|uniref:Uncharacterized protein n=1 Tax=Phytophthora oleae TaxID=2107226 RepID=A0ABD3EU35_9STRA
MPYTLCLSFLAVHGTVIMVGLPNDFKRYPLVDKGADFKGSVIGSIQDKDMLEVASKKNVRAVFQKLPMSKVKRGHSGGAQRHGVLPRRARELTVASSRKMLHERMVN